ncbi:LysR family transcriptional regulator [Nitrincola lacisaponensis]|uniref:LysR family transcriptional regulator n=1 Tax=Nitrincola lacisaponensis TaxID=267850 RepID=UPI001EF9EE59|nr:LysR family transcriptional regulator [Nitrincola lacisaponensis]
MAIVKNDPLEIWQMKEINLNSLKSLMVFKTLYESDTATRAAKALGLTQSGVSRSLAQLEENIGMPLFMRHKNRLIKLPEADELYQEIMQLMGNLDEMKHTIVALREFGVSRMRLASAPALGFAFIPEAIARILRINPKYSIYFDIMPSPDVVRAIESGHFDAGFVTLPINSERLIVDELFEVEAVCLVPANHPLASAEQIEITDFRNQHLVIPNQPNLAADQVLRLISQHKIRIAGKTEANIAAICSLVANGVGLSLINPITAYDTVAVQRDIVVKPFRPALHYRFGLAYRRSWADTQLIHLLKENLPETPRYLGPTPG